MKDGIEDVHALELGVMEIQLLRFSMVEDKPLEELGQLARELNVNLSVHTPYYIDIFGDAESKERSLENIIQTGHVANELGANLVISNIGLFGDYMKKKGKALTLAIEEITNLRDYYKDQGFKCKLGFETSGREKIFGSLKEVLKIAKKVDDVVPVINFPNIHAREGGVLKKKEAFQSIFKKVKRVTKEKDFYCQFSGVEHDGRNIERYTPIKKGDMKFEPLAECLLDNEDYKVTIISNSPLLEHDAVYMRLILNRVKTKRLNRLKRQKEKEKRMATRAKARAAKKAAKEQEKLEKQQKKPKDDDCETEPKTDGEAPKKRKRGRKKKTAPETSDDKPPVKRKRGRPRKIKD